MDQKWLATHHSVEDLSNGLEQVLLREGMVMLELQRLVAKTTHGVETFQLDIQKWGSVSERETKPRQLHPLFDMNLDRADVEKWMYR